MKILQAITVLLLILLPIKLFADGLQTPTMFVEKYDANPLKKYYKQNQFSLLMGGEEEATLNAKEPYPHKYVIDYLQKALKSKAATNQSEADYHVIFIDIPMAYENKWKGGKLELPDINPKIYKNKYDSKLPAYHFSSPWIRGTLYIKDSKPIGGTIIIPVSSFSRINELYHASHEEWDLISAKDSSVLNEMSVSKEDVYNPTLQMYEKNFLNSKEASPTEKRIKEIFFPKGKQALMLANGMRISSQNTIIPFERFFYKKMGECLKHSEVFYNKLYDYLFAQLFAKVTTPADTNTVYNISISTEVLQSLHDTSGNYNCFSPDFKEDNQ
jgi:hypothetical protein